MCGPKRRAIFVLVLKKILTIKIGEGIGAAKLALFSEQFFFLFFFLISVCWDIQVFLVARKELDFINMFQLIGRIHSEKPTMNP